MKYFSDTQGKGYSCVLLNGPSTYQAWAYALKEHLETAGLDSYVAGPVSENAQGKSSDESKSSESEDVKKAQEAESILLSTIDPGEIAKILHCQTAREIWAHFEKSYGTRTSNVKLELLSELNSFHCSSPADHQQDPCYPWSANGAWHPIG